MSNVLILWPQRREELIGLSWSLWLCECCCLWSSVTLVKSRQGLRRSFRGRVRFEWSQCSVHRQEVQSAKIFQKGKISRETELPIHTHTHTHGKPTEKGWCAEHQGTNKLAKTKGNTSCVHILRRLHSKTNCITAVWLYVFFLLNAGVKVSFHPPVAKPQTGGSLSGQLSPGFLQELYKCPLALCSIFNLKTVNQPKD